MFQDELNTLCRQCLDDQDQFKAIACSQTLVNLLGVDLSKHEELYVIGRSTELFEYAN